MATDEPTQVLDVRGMDEPPFDVIIQALQDLSPGDSLVLVNSFEPTPLFAVLDDRGFSHRTSKVSENEWHVEITADT